MFKASNEFESKVWLSSPTMHGPEIEYAKEAYERRKYAFVSDYLRLYILFSRGVYMDTDVKVLKKLD